MYVTNNNRQGVRVEGKDKSRVEAHISRAAMGGLPTTSDSTISLVFPAAANPARKVPNIPWYNTDHPNFD
jgi:hypothetical protein